MQNNDNNDDDNNNKKSFRYHSKLLNVNKAFVQLEEDKETEEKEHGQMKQRRKEERREGVHVQIIYTAARLLKAVECCRLQIPDQPQRSVSSLSGRCTPDLNGF